MKKNWSNPEVKNLALEATCEEYGGAYVIEEDGAKLGIQEALVSDNTKIVVPVWKGWRYFCLCSGLSNEKYKTPCEAAEAFINHWNANHRCNPGY